MIWIVKIDFKIVDICYGIQIKNIMTFIIYSYLRVMFMQVTKTIKERKSSSFLKICLQKAMVKSKLLRILMFDKWHEDRVTMKETKIVFGQRPNLCQTEEYDHMVVSRVGRKGNTFRSSGVQYM